MKNILGSNTEEVKGYWRKSGNGLRGLYFSSRIQVIKLSMKCAGHVVCVCVCVWGTGGMCTVC